MKMSSIFKKASVFAIAVTMALLMVISVLPAVFAAEGETQAVANEKLAATNITITGGITMQYYFTGDFDEGDYAKVSYPRQDGTLIEVEYALKEDGNGRYLIEVPITFAQQTETITIQWVHDGTAGKVFKLIPRDYADLVFKYAKLDTSLPQYAKYEQVKKNAEAMVPLVTYMLNAGAQAQISNNYKMEGENKLPLANEGLFAADTNPIDNMLADHFYDVDKREEHDTTGTGVTFTGTNLFLQSKVNLRVYLTCPDDVTTAKVYKGADDEIGQTVYIQTKNEDGVQRKYVGINNIVPTDFNTRFVVKVGEATFEYSVLDYAYNTVKSPFTDKEEKDTAKSLYLFYTYAREFTSTKNDEGKPTYVVGPKEKDESGKLVVDSTGTPVASMKQDESGNLVSACDHTRSYTTGTVITCPDCGYKHEKEVVQLLVSTVSTTGIEKGKTGEITLTYAIAGNTEFTGLLIAPSLPKGITWSAVEGSAEFEAGLEGVIMRNCEIDTTVPFKTGKIVTVTYTIDATDEDVTVGANEITFKVTQATDANGEMVEDEVLSTILSTKAYFDVLPEKCADGEHTYKYSIDTNVHYQICSKCYDSIKADHSYATKTETIGSKIVYSHGACECGAVKDGGRTYTYELGFTGSNKDDKKAPLLVLTPSDIKDMGTTRVVKGDIAEDGSYITLHDHATETGEGYLNVFGGKDNRYGVTGQYLMIKYRTTYNANMQFFFGANNGTHLGAYGGDNFYISTDNKSLVANGEWQTVILDLSKIGPSYFKAETEGENAGKYMADYIRWDIFDSNPTEQQSVDVAYIAMSDDIMSLASFDGNDIYTVCQSTTLVGEKKYVHAVGAYMASTVTLNPFFNASWLDVANNTYSGIDISAKTDSANNNLHYAEFSVLTESTGTDRYLYLIGDKNVGSGQVAPTAATTKYVAIMYRKYTNGDRFQWFISSNGTTASGNGDMFIVNSASDYKVDSQWHFTISDLSQLNTNKNDTSKSRYFDPAEGLKCIRFDYHDKATGAAGTKLTDVAFVAFFSTKEEAYDYMGEYAKTYLNVENGQGCKHDVYSKSANDCYEHCVYCGEKGQAYHTPDTVWTPVITEGATKLSEQLACTACGEATQTRSLPMKSWHNATFCDDTKVIGSMAMGKVDDTEHTVQNVIKVNGWLAINGGGVQKYVYRITDGNGNVGAWTQVGGSYINTTQSGLINEVAKNPDVQDWNHNSDFTGTGLHTGDLQAYVGQTIKVEFAAIPASNPGTETNPNTIMIVTLNKVTVECDHANEFVLDVTNPKQLICYECSRCGAENITKVAQTTQAGLHVFIPGINVGNSSNVITEENGFSYLRLKASDDPDGKKEDRAKIYSSATPITNAGRYVAVLWKSTVSGTVQIGMDNSSSIKTGVNNVGTASANQWTFGVIKYNDHTSYTLEHGPGNVSFDYFNYVARTTNDYVDVAFIAFFDNEQDAHDYYKIYVGAYLGEENCQHGKTYVDTNDDCTVKCYYCNKVMSDVQHGKTYVDTNDGCAVKCYYCNKAMGDVQHGETSWQFISNAGTEFAGTRYAVEGNTCNDCGKVLETRNAVITVNFDCFNVSNSAGTTTKYSWGASSAAAMTDPAQRTFALYGVPSYTANGNTGNKYDAPTFLKSDGTIDGGGWAGINGLFSATSYYRVLDENGNILLDWTAASNSRSGALEATNGVVTTVNDRLSKYNVTSDARRFTMNAIDLSAYASYYQSKDASPITLEYALQAEGAPEGSDLITVVKVTNIYMNCAKHDLSVSYVDENGVRTGYATCNICGCVTGSHSIALGNKAPNLFLGASELANSTASASMSSTFTISDDGSYVTFTNTAGKGDAYIEIFKNNTTVTGRYMLIKYRTNAASNWQFFTSSNYSKPYATGGVSTFTLAKGVSGVSAGIIVDNNWHYTIIDIAAMSSTFKAYEDGTYMAQFLRIDIFNDAISTTQTTDIAFIAFADSRDTLTAMDGMVTYHYGFNSAGGTGVVLPMSTTTGTNNPFFDANYVALRGSDKGGTVKYEASLNNMPYAQLTASASGEQSFYLWTNKDYKLSGSGRYVGVLYRASSGNKAGMEFYVNSNSTGAASGCSSGSKSTTADGVWRFVYHDISKIKTSDGKVYYNPEEGIGSIRFDFLDKAAAAGETIDIAFVGFFDDTNDIVDTLSKYNELYGVRMLSTPLAIDVPETSINANGTFNVTVSAIKGGITSGKIQVSGLPTDAVVDSYVLGAGVTGSVSSTGLITITNIDIEAFDGTIATMTFKTTYDTTGKTYTLSAVNSGNLTNGTNSFTPWGTKDSDTITVVAHECTTFGEYAFTATQHSRACTDCGKTVSENHTLGNNVTTDDAGNVSYTTTCSVCGFTFSKLTANAEKNPLVVYSANNILSVLKANTAQHGFFQGFQLLQDEDGTGFVRITSNGTNTDPYAYVYKPSSVTETGRYLTIRYRIPASNGNGQTKLQVFASTTNGGMNGNDTSGNIFPVAEQSDNEWRTLVIDLTENGSTYTADENGKYSAKYIRLDFFGDKSSSDGDYFDIQFITISDSLTDYVSDGVTKFSENTSYYCKSTGTVHDFDQFTGLMSWLGDEKLGGQYIVTEANGLTYNKFISKTKQEQNITLYSNANGLKPVSDYIAVIYRAPKTVMINGTRVNNKAGYYQMYINSQGTSVNGSSYKDGSVYTMDGTWKLMFIDLSTIGATYDPATGVTSFRLDYFNTNNNLIQGAELHIAAIGFVESSEAATAWYNEFLKAYYPEGQTEYITDDVCAAEHHTELTGWLSAGVGEDGNLREKKVCFSCGTVLEERNIWFRGWMNGYYINDTKINSGNLYSANVGTAVNLSGKGTANTFKLAGWFAAESGVKAYYYRINGGEWIQFTDVSITSAEDSGIKGDVDKQGMGIDSYWTNSKFNGYLKTGDLAVDYAGQTVTLEFGFAPVNNPDSIQLIKTFTNLQIADTALAAE